MSKIILEDAAAGYNIAAINRNFDKIADEFQNKVLYRVNPGGEPNMLQSDIDVNGHVLYNLPKPVLLSQAARLQDVIDAQYGDGSLTAAAVGFTPYSDVSATNVQTALESVITKVNTLPAPTKLLVVDNYTALRAALKTGIKTVQVLGKTTPNDGFGGIYQLDLTDTTSTDNNGEIIVATDGGRWKYVTNKGRPSGFFTGNGSKPERFGDKVFMGDAVVNDGKYPSIVPDQLAVYQSYFYPGNTPPTCTTAVVALAGFAGSPFPGQAILGGASSKAAGAPGGNAIGLQGYGIAENTTFGGDFSWGLYAEGHRAHGATGNCYGAEICVVNRGGVKVITPYTADAGATIGIQIDSGVGFPVAEMSGIQSASSAMVIVDNGGGTVPFLNGIVFINDSLARTPAITGTAEAIVMARGHNLRWYKGNGVAGPTVSSSISTGNNTNIVFTDSGLQIQNSAGQSVAQFGNNSTSPNSFNFDTGMGTGVITMSAVGAGPNVSIKLQPMGTGLVSFGTWTATTGSVNGFILILDSSGNQRKLATIA